MKPPQRPSPPDLCQQAAEEGEARYRDGKDMEPLPGWVAASAELARHYRNAFKKARQFDEFAW
jgi:hypothetical protein